MTHAAQRTLLNCNKGVFFTRLHVALNETFADRRDGPHDAPGEVAALL